MSLSGKQKDKGIFLMLPVWRQSYGLTLCPQICMFKPNDQCEVVKSCRQEALKVVENAAPSCAPALVFPLFVKSPIRCWKWRVAFPRHCLVVPSGLIPPHLEMSKTSLHCCISYFCIIVIKYLAEMRQKRHIPAVVEPMSSSFWGTYGGTATFLLGFGKCFWHYEDKWVLHQIEKGQGQHTASDLKCYLNTCFSLWG